MLSDSYTNELFIRSAKYFAAVKSQEGVKVKEFIYLIWSHLHSQKLFESSSQQIKDIRSIISSFLRPTPN